MRTNAEIYKMLVDTRNDVQDACWKNYLEMTADPRFPLEAINKLLDERDLVVGELTSRIEALRTTI